MEDKHRKRITDNIDRIISRTDFNKLTYACLTSGLLTPVMVQNVNRVEIADTGVPWTEERMQYERHKKLFLKITKRGPDAFEMLRRILADLKYDSALGILTDDDSYVSIHNNKVPSSSSSSTSITTATMTTGGGDVTATIPSEEGTMSPYADDINFTNNDNRRFSTASNGEDRNISQQQIDRRLSTKSSNGELVLEEFDGEICPKEMFEVRRSKKIQKHPSLETYPMQTKENRGVFFMVNMIDFLKKDDRRQGADEDAHSLLHLFKEMGFKLFSYTNLSQDEFFKILEELLSSDYTKNTECFVMALMTHGNMDDNVQRVMFSDGSVVKVNDIEKYFHHHICENLVHKPKIFLFPFCRGDISERGILSAKIQTDSITYNNNRVNNIPQLSDVIVCYATSKGFKSHRDIEDGSWYIQSFVKNMADNAHDTSFEDIVKKIQADTAKLRTYEGHLQTANFVNKGFNNVLYFNPGVWLE